MICAVAAVWCGATAVKAALALAHRESYIVSWWDASVAGTGRKLGSTRTAIKLVAMLAIAAMCVLALAHVIEPSQALYVAIAYIAIQQTEGQILIPLLMKGGIDLPPVLTILAQAAMALVFGFLGLMVAVPLLAAVMVPLRIRYVEQEEAGAGGEMALGTGG